MQFFSNNQKYLFSCISNVGICRKNFIFIYRTNFSSILSIIWQNLFLFNVYLMADALNSLTFSLILTFIVSNALSSPAIVLTVHLDAPRRYCRPLISRQLVCHYIQCRQQKQKFFIT